MTAAQSAYAAVPSVANRGCFAPRLRGWDYGCFWIVRVSLGLVRVSLGLVMVRVRVSIRATFMFYLFMSFVARAKHTRCACVPSVRKIRNGG